MRKRRHPTPLRAVSLFSNCGAGDVGFADAGSRDARNLLVHVIAKAELLGIARLISDDELMTNRPSQADTSGHTLAAVPGRPDVDYR